MPLPVVRPGQTHPAVVKLKQAVVQALKQRNHDQLAGSINQRSRTYGPSAVRAVKVVQRDKQLQADGVVGARTWHALGYSGSAQDAPPEQQDAAAVQLQQRAGWDQWTTAKRCGR